MRYIIIFMIFGAAYLAACTKTQDPGTSTAVKVANEWWVNNKKGEMVKLTTYNTASNPDSIWVNSLDTLPGDGYRFQCKAKVDLNTLTFSTQNMPNVSVHMANSVTITNGKILPGVGHSLTGNPTDSIFLEVQFSDDPVKYTISGHGRTMWDVDEY